MTPKRCRVVHVKRHLWPQLTAEEEYRTAGQTFCFIYRQEHTLPFSLQSFPIALGENKWNGASQTRHAVLLVKDKFSLAWHGMVWQEGRERDGTDRRVGPIKKCRGRFLASN